MRESYSAEGICDEMGVVCVGVAEGEPIPSPDPVEEDPGRLVYQGGGPGAAEKPAVLRSYPAVLLPLGQGIKEPV